MKILLDMNLSPSWAEFLQSVGIDAIHWSAIGDPMASDTEICLYAKPNGYTLMTSDLDFGQIAFADVANAPSAILLRVQDERIEAIGAKVATVIQSLRAELEAGAFVVLEDAKVRIRNYEAPD